MTRLPIRVGTAVLATVVILYGCGQNAGTPAGPETNRSNVATYRIDCGEIGYLSQLSPVLPVWKDSIQTWLGDTELLNDTPTWLDGSTVAGYLGELVPVLQQWEPAINGALGSALLDTVADFDPSGSTSDYLTGLSSLLATWKDSLETERGMAFLADLPAFNPDVLPPVIVCPSNVTVECADPSGEVVEFVVTATDECDPAPAVTCEPASGSVFPVGTTTVTCTAVDFSGNTSTCTFDVTIKTDTTPPVVSDVSASPDHLWAPNHTMVDVEVFATMKDDCDPSPSCKIVEVTSNQPINGKGDGNTEPDWEITGDMTLKLRAERSGALGEREYTIHCVCTDASGNHTDFTVEVEVPHDQGEEKK